MNKVLRKRLGRELRHNCMRYLALTLLIVMGMYIVVGIVDKADSISVGTKKIAESNHIEDGEFTVFVPLTKEQKKEIKKQDIELEEAFYCDVETQGEKTIRVFKQREKINKIALDCGELAKKSKEAVIEKRFAEENNLKLKDTLKVGGDTYTIVGIGSVPDYDLPVKNSSDVAAENSRFGLMFITAEQYKVAIEENPERTQTYNYAYRLKGSTSDGGLKLKLEGFSLDYQDVEDKYFKEEVDEKMSIKDELSEGMDELADGTKELEDGLGELTDQNKKLQGGAEEIFESTLEQATTSIQAMGVRLHLTKRNYEDNLDQIAAQATTSEQKNNLAKLKDNLKQMENYVDGVNIYTQGVSDSKQGAKKISEGMREFQTETEKKIEKMVDLNLNNLVTFTKAKDNPRIYAASADVVLDKNIGLIAGVIVIILFTYVISVFIVHQIQSESSVIGTLYAMGVRKHQLIRHYLTLPVLVSFLGGCIGCVLGFCPFGAGYQMQDTYDYFSIPKVDIIYPPYLIAYGVLMPPIVAAIVNYLVINKKLSQTVLSLIKNEQKATTGKKVNISSEKFLTTFQLRQLLRESRTCFTVVFGMLISLLVFMIGLDCYVLCGHIQEEMKRDATYQYMYTLKYPEDKEYDNASKVFAKTLAKSNLGYTLDIMLMGIDQENPYFSCSTRRGENCLSISKSVQQKYGLKVGDSMILEDRTKNRSYAFTVKNVADYSGGLTVFMDIESMRSLFGEEEDYYNVLLSKEKLDIPEGRVYSITTKEDIERAADVFVKLFMPLIRMLIGAATIIFCVVMYLMNNVMVDRASFGISLVKIFGYRRREIKKVYLTGNLYVVILGGVVCIPLAKKIADLLYPGFLANATCGMNLSFTWYLYVAVFVGVVGIYWIVNWLLVRKIDKLSYVEVLKDRE